MQKVVPVFAVLLLLFLSYASTGQANATNADILIVSLEMEPKSPIAGQRVTVTTIITNKSDFDMPNAQISYSLDGVWVIDDMHVNVPSKKSVKTSFTMVMPVKPGQHQLKSCPERKALGDEGDQCQILDFTAIDESSIVVAILSPKEEEVLHGTATVKVAAFGGHATKVELYLQGKLVTTKNQEPFDFTLDTTKFDDGEYRMHVIAYYDSGIAKPSSVKKYFIDNSGGVILTVKSGSIQEAQAKVGQNVIIESDITNQQSLKIAATFIVLVKNSDGYTDFLSWKEDKISANETLPLSQSWVPEAAGSYTIQVFLWDTIETSVPLTDVMRAKVVVS